MQPGSHVEAMYKGCETCITVCSTIIILYRETQGLKTYPKTKSKYPTVMHRHYCLPVIPQEGKHVFSLPRSCGPLMARGPAGKLYHLEEHPFLAGDNRPSGRFKSLLCYISFQLVQCFPDTVHNYFHPHNFGKVFGTLH